MAIHYDAQLVLKLTQKELDDLDKYAKRLGVKRSQLVRNLIKSGIDDLNLLSKFGIVSLVGFIRANNIEPKAILELALEE
jgi:metal-responsive CopG/Arc/MetJ family transcriptional regulator